MANEIKNKRVETADTTIIKETRIYPVNLDSVPPKVVVAPPQKQEQKKSGKE